MGDAWIYSSGPATDDLVRLLAELGFSPRRVRPGDAVATRVTSRPPVFAMIVAGREDPSPNVLCAELRTRRELTDVPLIVAVEPEHLRSGSDLADADELLVPPYSAAELRVRVARARRASAPEDRSDEVVRVGSLELDFTNHEVTIAGEVVAFTRMEYELLKFLVTHPRRVFTRDALLTTVWGYSYYGSGRTVDVHIRRLRAKLGPKHSERIRTVRSVGYLFENADQKGGVERALRTA